MAEDGAEKRSPQASILELLREQGLNLEGACCEAGGEASHVKVVCVAADLREAVAQLGQTARDHVVMVRIDEDTSRKLDAWVETGAVRSRSEAAALFIREGLKVREQELTELEQALKGVRQAKERLREKASAILGTRAPAKADIPTPTPRARGRRRGR